MSVKIRNVYYYAVCLITLVICIFAVTGIVDGITDLIIPYQGYLPSPTNLARQYKDLSPEMQEKISFEEWAEQEREMRVKRERVNRRHRLIKNLTKSLTLLLVALPLYIYHWRRVRQFED